MFSRTWVSVLGASVLFYLFNAAMRPDAGSVPPTSADVLFDDPLEQLAHCLEDVPLRAAEAAAVAVPPPSVESLYRASCRSVVTGPSFTPFASRYGDLARDVAAALLRRQEAYARGVLAASDGAGLDPDVVWHAALGRAAVELRAFGADLQRFYREAGSGVLLPPIDVGPDVTPAASGGSVRGR